MAKKEAKLRNLVHYHLDIREGGSAHYIYIVAFRLFLSRDGYYLSIMRGHHLRERWRALVLFPVDGPSDC